MQDECLGSIGKLSPGSLPAAYSLACIRESIFAHCPHGGVRTPGCDDSHSAAVYSEPNVCSALPILSAQALLSANPHLALMAN